MNWNEDEVAQLKNLIAVGLTASQIALEMGCTRSAILGKMSRLGIESASDSKHRNVNQSRRRERPKTIQPSHPWRTATSRAPSEPPPPKQESDIVRCGIFDLTSKTCRWPIGDPNQPGFGFCGDVPVPGVPYCRMHAARAFS